MDSDNNLIIINKRKIGTNYKPFVIAEIGINHNGEFKKAIQMVDDAARAGCECVKFQSHILEDEMIPNDVIPGNTSETIWSIIMRCQLTEDEEKKLKGYTEKKGMIFLSTPFSRRAADRLRKMGVSAFKIGSGECNNYPLIEHIAKFGKPVILSTGMNNLDSITSAVRILQKYKIRYALLHCTSLYPTPYNLVRLGALNDLRHKFPEAVLGLSDHSLDIYTSLAAIPLGAAILEKHFTSDSGWPGPDIPISLTPDKLKDLIIGSKAIYQALGGRKEILKEESPTINFAYACVVSTKQIMAGETLTSENIWIKRPGTGEIKAAEYRKVLGKRARYFIPADAQIRWKDLI